MLSSMNIVGFDDDRSVEVKSFTPASRPLLSALFLGMRHNKGRREGAAFIYGRAVMEN